MGKKWMWISGLSTIAFLGWIFAVCVEVLSADLNYWGLSPLAYLGIGLVLYTLTRVLVAGMGGGRDGVGKR